MAHSTWALGGEFYIATIYNGMGRLQKNRMERITAEVLTTSGPGGRKGYKAWRVTAVLGRVLGRSWIFSGVCSHPEAAW